MLRDDYNFYHYLLGARLFLKADNFKNLIMDPATYKAFLNWDSWDGYDEEYLCMKDDDKRKIDDPELNQDDPQERQEFDDSDDFHKYDDTDEDEPETENSGKNNGEIAI
jgi:hypothetical protein